MVFLLAIIVIIYVFICSNLFYDLIHYLILIHPFYSLSISG